MEKQIIITSGKKYIDIDAYAGIFAYQILLRSLGYSVSAVTTAVFNESISSLILDLGFQFDDVEVREDAKFILLDVSNPDFFDVFVKRENIVEIIDHHVGFEDYWNQEHVLNQIEFIGSICTIIFERFLEHHQEHLLSPNLCKLLVSGILDNTLNLKSQNTTARDLIAYQKLLEIGSLDETWPLQYFNSCYQDIEKHLEESILNDLKIEFTSSLIPEVFGQMIVLDCEVIVSNYERVMKTFQSYSHWMFNVISLKDGKSYLFYSDLEVLKQLSYLFSGHDTGKCLVLEKCLLRKEIMKIAREQEALL